MPSSRTHTKSEPLKNRGRFPYPFLARPTVTDSPVTVRRAVFDPRKRHRFLAKSGFPGIQDRMKFQVVASRILKESSARRCNSIPFPLDGGRLSPRVRGHFKAAIRFFCFAQTSFWEVGLRIQIQNRNATTRTRTRT